MTSALRRGRTMRPRRTYIVAGNHAQYQDWLTRGEHDPSEYRYVSRAEDLFGIHLGANVRFLGTVYDRTDWPRLRDALEQRGLSPDESQWVDET